jgi:tetratricopeptide (TPR) repeat protein
LKNDFDPAISDATRAIQLDSKYGFSYGTRGWSRYGKGDLAGALEDCAKAVELEGVNSLDAAGDQGMIDFINNDYKRAVDSWQRAAQADASVQREIQPWIEKAKAKLSAAK